VQIDNPIEHKGKTYERFYEDGPEFPKNDLHVEAEKAFRDSFVKGAHEAKRWEKPDFAAIEDARKAREKVRNKNSIRVKDGHYAYLPGHQIEAAATRGRHHALEFVNQDWDFLVKHSKVDGRSVRFLLFIWASHVSRWSYENMDPLVVSPPPRPEETFAPKKVEDKPADKPVVSHIVAIPLADVEGKDIQWFWPNRIPSGMLSLLVGNPGVGKSFLTMFICSRVSTGEDWPDAENTMEPGSVLLFSDEESLEYAIKPRLDSHGADCTKIFAVPHIKKADGNPDTFCIDEHIQLLRDYLEEVPDCRLIIFDPITAYLGAVNANNNAEVRGALIGLQSLAQEKKVTILGINHFSKKADLDAIHRILRSTGFVAAARAVWAVIQESYRDDFEGEPGRLLIPVKSNYSIAPTALKFHIVDGQIVFEDGQHQANIDVLLQNAKKKGGRRSSKRDAIVKWLEERIGEEPVLADDLKAEAEEKGFNWRYVQYIANDIGIHKAKSEAHSNKSIWMKEST